MIFTSDNALFSQSIGIWSIVPDAPSSFMATLFLRVTSIGSEPAQRACGKPGANWFLYFSRLIASLALVMGQKQTDP